MRPEDILHFWFDEISSKLWWQKDPNFDKLIEKRFTDVHLKAKHCELFSWRSFPEGSLAEIIILDQFSRNIFRNQAESFLQDAQALCLSQQAIAAGFDKKLVPDKRTFLYMPFMHSESKLIHQQAMALFEAPGLEDNLDFERRHKAIIDRFGRYPHRNQILGRRSTPEELVFLQQPGSSF